MHSEEFNESCDNSSTRWSSFLIILVATHCISDNPSTCNNTTITLDDDTDNVLSPLDDMMDRHRSRLEKGKLRTWEGEPGDPDDENNMLSVDNPMRYK